MANHSINMNKLRQILRLYSSGISKLQIAEQTGVARNTIKKYIKEFTLNELSFTEVNSLCDKDLEDLFVKPVTIQSNPKLETLFSLFPAIDKKLKKKGVTRQLLWADYKSTHSDGVGRSQFNRYFSSWKSQVSPTMRMNHKAGDKLYVDFAGDKLSIIDKQTGEVQYVEVFVAILGASQLTYVEAVMSQQKDDFIGACEGALLYYGGVPAAIVPDNLKSAVIKSSKYEPVLNDAFADFAQHYSTTILPARAYKPRDKALVENAVRIIYNRIYTKIRGTDYFTLEELNVAIKVALEEHNSLLLTGRN
jgi:transposase